MKTIKITKEEIEKKCKQRFIGNIYKWAGTATLDKAIEQYKNFLVQKDLGTLPENIMDYPIMGLKWDYVDDLLEVFRYHETVGYAYNCFIKNLNNAWKGFFKFHNKDWNDVYPIYNLFGQICELVHQQTYVFEPIHILSERKGLDVWLDNAMNAEDEYRIFIGKECINLTRADLSAFANGVAEIIMLAQDQRCDKVFRHSVVNHYAQYDFEISGSKPSSGTENMVRYNDKPHNYVDIKITKICPGGDITNKMEYKCFSIYGLLALLTYFM